MRDLRVVFDEFLIGILVVKKQKVKIRFMLKAIKQVANKIQLTYILLSFVYSLIIMRLLSLVLQNKKGENIIIATSPSLHTSTCILYSNFMYEHILETYRRRLKIERTLTLEPNLSCVLSINKDYILYIFVQKNDLSLAFDGVKKITEFFNSNIKMFAGASGQVRLEIIGKKFVEFMSCMEEFLYTREISVREYLPLLPQPASRKKGVEQEIFNKFSHISNQNDRRIIYDSHIQSSMIQAAEVKRRCRTLEQAKKLTIKNSDDLDILEVDPQRESYLANYRRNIAFFASCGRRKSAIQQMASLQLVEAPSTIEPLQEVLEQQEILEETVIDRQKMKIRMNEKLELTLQNAKIKEVLQFGQILIEGSQKQIAQVNLCSSQTHWNNQKLINKRISPVSVASVIDMGSRMKFSTQANYKSKPILDYIIRKESFTPDKIPLLFVYSREVSSSNIEFTFKYKINEKWRHRLYDVDISVFLNKEFMVMDCKSVPSAYSLKNNRITWKTKEIMPLSHNSKGKIILAFGSSNISPKNIIKEIKLSMKANCGLIQNLRAECIQDWGYTAQPEKMLLIEYKISPNDESKDMQDSSKK